MFRLSQYRKDKAEVRGADVHEPSRPRAADKFKERRSSSYNSTAVPPVVARPSKPTVPSASDQFKSTPYHGYEPPRLTKTPWELDRSKRHSAWRKPKPQITFPAHFFKELPREVYDCIVMQLEQLHLGESQACSSCLLKDLHSLTLTSRAWDKAATAIMYRKVLLPTNEEHAKLPKLKIKGMSRLKLLRRTLRERNGLARCVRELHLPDFQALYQNASIEREEIINLVASLVMACPRLERLVGFHVPFSPSFDRLSHALATRSCLEERVWLPADADSDASEDEDETMAGHYIAACDPIERFLDLNSKHPLLSTLVLHQAQEVDQNHLNFRAIVGTFRAFPKLRHLSVSGLAATSFTSMALSALPAQLKSLRLEDLPGVSDKGLQRFATSKAATSITNLSLINLEISSMDSIAKVLSARLSNLRNFTLIQNKAPKPPSRNAVCNFESPFLHYIHWEIRSEASPLPSFSSPSSVDLPEQPSFPFTNLEPICCLATSILATSIKNGAFPSLRRIRIPHDPQGVIQALCKPLATALLPSDTSVFAMAPRISTSNGFSIRLDQCNPWSPRIHGVTTYAVSSSPRADSALGSPTSSHGNSESFLTPIRSRLAAQSRILVARKNAAITVRVFDPQGEVRVNKVIGGYIGHVGSKITYDLKADRNDGVDGSVGRSEWITGMDDLVGGLGDDGGGWSVSPRRACGHVGAGKVGGGITRVEDLF